jgi:hypothetical protein
LAFWLELPDLDEIETEGFNLSQHTVESRSIEPSREHCVRAVRPGHQGRERRQSGGPEMAGDADGVAGWHWVHQAVHEAIVDREQVNHHHQDLVNAGSSA